MVSINIIMEFEEHYNEFKILYKFSDSRYVPKSSWSTEKDFVESYPTIKKQFVLITLVPTPGIEPGSTDFQSAAMTTFAKLA